MNLITRKSIRVFPHRSKQKNLNFWIKQFNTFFFFGFFKKLSNLPNKIFNFPKINKLVRNEGGQANEKKTVSV